jgi:glutamyl-tRNA reductase
MAAPVKRNQGKTDFVKTTLKQHPQANPKFVNEAWISAGNEGTISETLVNKMRAELGLSGNLRKRTPRAGGGVATKAVALKYTGKKRGRKPKSALFVGTGATSANGDTHATTSTSQPTRQQHLAELESEIDALLFKVMNIGNLPEIEDSLRKTRRMLYGGFR